MGIEWGPVIPGIVAAVLGIATGVTIPLIAETLKERRERNYRWDEAQYELAKELAAKSRLMLHLCRRYKQLPDRPAARAKIGELHGEIRSITEQLRVLADEACVKHAWEIRRHLYAIYRTKVLGEEDERATEYANEPVEARYQKALRDFFVATRKQLRVKPEFVVLDEGYKDNPWYDEAV